MRILWGINGTGNGHITKSLHLITELEKRGHQITTLVSGHSKGITIPRKIDKFCKGFTFKYNDGAVDLLETIKHLSPISFLHEVKLDLNSYDLVITDFEPITAWAAKLKEKKSIGISHQYAFNSNSVPLPEESGFLARAFMKWFAPVYLSIGLHFEKWDKGFMQPIIRKQVIEASNQNLGHVTVYLPGFSAEYLSDIFSRFNREIHIFSEVQSNYSIERCKLFKPDLELFTKSLTTCDICVTGAGFETPSEALYLRKKLIVIPLKRQWEQLANAAALKKMGVCVVSSPKEIIELDCDRIKWNWQDPTTDIIKIIENY